MRSPEAAVGGAPHARVWAVLGTLLLLLVAGVAAREALGEIGPARYAVVRTTVLFRPELRPGVAAAMADGRMTGLEFWRLERHARRAMAESLERSVAAQAAPAPPAPHAEVLQAVARQYPALAALQQLAAE